MGSSYVTDPVTFLIDAIFGLYVMVVMLRFLFQVVRADFYNPISQFVVKVTNPPLKPLRRVVPSVFGLDMATLLLAFILQVLTIWLVYTITGKAIPIASLLILSVGELVSLVLNIYLFSIFVIVILSWINPGTYNPVVGLLHSLTEPVMRPARRILPPIAGLDLSPILVLLAIQVLKMLLLPPFQALAVSVA